MADSLHLALLGGLRVTLNDAPVTGFVSGKVQALFCYLVVTGRPQPRPALATLFWGAQSEDAASTNLRQAITNLRRLVEPYLVITRQTVAFNTAAPYTLDVETFERELQGLDALEQASSTAVQISTDALGVLGRAVEQYTGDFLQGFSMRDAPAFDEWALIQQERLRELALRALHLLAAQHTLRGEYVPALTYTSRELALDAWHEEAHRQMMLLLARTGRHAAALVQYERCRQLLRDELGVEPMPETTTLYERIRTAQLTRRAALPPQPTPFVGREQECAELARRLADSTYRLLSIVGPGGVGKTRLALHVAADQGARFLHGSAFVPLATVATAPLLVSSMATALGLTLRGGEEPKAQLLNYLREKELLLVVDNFEHLIDVGADVLAEVLQQAPEVRLLVTSRERLNLQEEWMLAVGGLPVPPLTALMEAEAYDAVALFLERARRVHAPLALENGDRACVVHICQLVEGLPLGLELAAASLRTLTCAEIAREIEHNLDLLHTTLRNVPERQRSLRATFEYSWQLLSAQEQVVYRRLSVFRGGFSRTAAEQVAGMTLPLLQLLSDKSLLRRSTTGRYDLHPVLRQYAEEKLAAVPDERVQTHDRHCRYYARFVRGHEEHLKGARQAAALAEIGDEIENVRGAWQWAVEHTLLDALDQASESLYQWYRIQGLSAEGADAFMRATDALAGAILPPDAPHAVVMGKLLARQGMFYAGSHNEEAKQLLDRALALVRPLDARHETAFALYWLAYIERSTGDYSAAQRLYGESLALREAIEDRGGVAMCLLGLAGTAYYLGDYEEAVRLARQGLPLARQLGDQKLIADLLIALGILAMTEGAYAEAQPRVEESLALSRAMGDREGMIICLTALGNMARALGDNAEAKRLCEESLLICQEIGLQLGIIDNLEALGDLLSDQGEYGEAYQRYQQCFAVADTLDDPAGKAQALAKLGGTTCAQGAYAESECFFYQSLHLAQDIQRVPVMLLALVGLSGLLLQTGRQTQALDLIAVALQHPALDDLTRTQAERLRTEIETTLPPDQIAAAQARAQARPLDEVVGTLLTPSAHTG